MAQISPGDLASPHAELEGLINCTKCHTLGGGPDIEKCLTCHVEIKQSLAIKRGYHFFAIVQNEDQCFECHSEHNGRNFKLIFWPDGKKNFDHTVTGYQLQGKHAEIKCEACHNPNNIVRDPRKLNPKVNQSKTFLGLDQTCLSCHRDEHRGQLSEDCSKCHNYSSWKPPDRFSHDRARFRLTGKHQKVKCIKCHPKALANNGKSKKLGRVSFTKFVGLQFGNCTACHQDAHVGRFGANCKKCHDTFGWHRILSDDFDHSLTRFPLLGKHADVSCAKCHIGGKVKKTRRFANCTDCHKDEHFGQFTDRADGGRCESCHDVRGFIPAKYGVGEHQTSTYPLTGAHLAVPCVACHAKPQRGRLRGKRVFEFADKTCKGCHVDVHKGQFAAQVQSSGCESCHQTSAWETTGFDHSKSRFPLIGKHEEVTCRKCHKVVDVGTSQERIHFRPMKMACSDCHKDIHFGQFAQGFNPKTCDQCHTAFGWAALIFNHDTDALFKLKGAHEKVECAKCHKLTTKSAVEFVLYKPMDKRCASCHG